MAIKIMLDAGHYTNYNRSNVFKDYYEGNMAFKLQSYLKDELKEYGFVVGVTRTNRDKDLDLYKRGYAAKGYDVFLSLHSNACDNKNVDRVVIIKGYDQPDSLAENFGIELTKTMNTQKHQIMIKKNNSGGEYYGVLRGAKSAGVKHRFILEHGFHTNSNCAKWLHNDTNIKKLAVANARVLADFYGYKKKTPSDASSDKKDVNDFVVRITTDTLNVRKGPGTNYDKISVVKKGEAYTITHTNNKGDWGYLKSGAGWISLDSSYVMKL